MDEARRYREMDKLIVCFGLLMGKQTEHEPVERVQSLLRDTLTYCLNEEWLVRPVVRKGLPEHKPIQSTHKVITSPGKNAAERAA